HIHPEDLRWELHRVWIVEAKFASGKRHVMPRRRFYLDEDIWMVFLVEGWDVNGKLWHVGHSIPLLAPDVPAIINTPHAIYDVQRRAYTVNAVFNEGHHPFEVVSRRLANAFTPAALAVEGVR